MESIQNKLDNKIFYWKFIVENIQTVDKFIGAKLKMDLEHGHCC